jgi:long-chain fatty acid transport protein
MNRIPYEKIFILVIAVQQFHCPATPVMASGIDNNSSLSAEYARTLNRNAATDSADVVAYNPAGVMRIRDGLYIDLSGQYGLTDYRHTTDGIRYTSDEPFFLPGLFALYKQERWAAFTAFTINGGGGNVDYEKGSATTRELAVALMGQVNTSAGFTAYDSTNSHSLEGESGYAGFTVGGAACVLDDKVSVSLGARYIYGREEGSYAFTITPSILGAGAGLTDRRFDVECEKSAGGWGGVMGVNVAPTERFNIGIRYETKTRLDFKTEVSRDDTGLLTDGAKERRDFPAVFALGIAYNDIVPDLRVEADYTYYVNKDADWNGTEDDVDNGFEVGLAFEYGFTPTLTGSLGYLYTEKRMHVDYITRECPDLDSHSFAAGVRYEVMPRLDLNFGILGVFYKGERTSTGIKLDAEERIVALGIQYKNN